MTVEIAKHVASCPQCQVNKASHQLPQGLLQPLAVPDERWQVVSMDFVTGLPRTRQGYDAIYVFVDKFSKMVHLAACRKTCSAAQAAHLFQSNVIKLHGTPEALLSDRDTRFTGTYWKAMCDALKIKSKLSTAYHPQTDGQTERTNKTVEEVLRNLISNGNKEWDLLLPSVEFAINNAKSASSGFSPFFLNYGINPRTPITNALATMEGGDMPALSATLSAMREVHSKVKVMLQAAQDRQAHYANKDRRTHTIAPNTYVLLSSKNLRFKGKGRKKLYPKFIGPFLVTAMMGPNAAQLSLPDVWQMHNVFHVNLLKPYKGVVKDGDLTALKNLPLDFDNIPEYEVDFIFAHRLSKASKFSDNEFLCKWQGMTQEHNSWEAEEKLPREVVDDYFKDVKMKA